MDQAYQAKTQILSTVTHELKAPLTGIVGYVDRLLEEHATVGPLNERQLKYLQVMKKNSSRLSALIDDIMDISRIESGSLELTFAALDVLQEVSEVIQGMEDQVRDSGVRVRQDIPPELLVKADQLRFGQIMTKLVSNACKYSSAGSTTTITAGEKAGMVQIDVADSGMGIEEPDLPRIFEKFFRADSSSTNRIPGTGLDLFITRRLVEAQGGLIWFRSEPGVGSTFSFTLPAAHLAPGIADAYLAAPLSTQGG